MARIKNALDQILKAVIACQPEPGDAPTRDIPETECPAGLNNALQGGAAGVCSAQDAAYARSRDMRNGHVVLFEDLQNAEMREAARETATESKADARLPGGSGGGRARTLRVLRHV